jgi:putative endopeptidase
MLRSIFHLKQNPRPRNGLEFNCRLKSDIPVLAWMGPETKKLWKNCKRSKSRSGMPTSGVITPRFPCNPRIPANVRRSISFEHARNLHKIGKPVDRTEGEAPQPSTLHYNSTMNEIVFLLVFCSRCF